MQTVDDQPETIHLYVVREEVPKPQIFPIFFFGLMLTLLSLLCVFSPYQQPVIRTTLRVPAVLLPLQTMTTTVAILPTGNKTYKATFAYGTLAITNGSIIASELPQGLILVARNGTEIVLDATAFAPAGSAEGYGFTTVPAHALISGRSGNIPAFAINQVEGTSIYIRNQEPFTGGRDAYTVKEITSQDEQTARNHARTMLLRALSGKLMLHPCKEFVTFAGMSLVVSWTCQFATYSLPAYMRVTGVRVEGKNILIDVVYTPRYIRIGEKE